MKASARSYAKALFELTEDLPKAQVKEVVGRFLQDLKDQQMLSKIETILSEYEHLSDKAAGIVRATIMSVHKVSKPALDDASALLLKRVKGESVVWTEIINPEILGGIKIQCGDLIIDMSLANRVSDLSAQIKK